MNPVASAGSKSPCTSIDTRFSLYNETSLDLPITMTARKEKEKHIFLISFFHYRLTLFIRAHFYFYLFSPLNPVRTMIDTNRFLCTIAASLCRLRISARRECFPVQSCIQAKTRNLWSKYIFYDFHTCSKYSFLILTRIMFMCAFKVSGTTILIYDAKSEKKTR